VIDSGHDIASFMAENLQEFRPIAYFDKHLDCIRVKLEDCSAVEVRLNRFLTILKPGPNDEIVGFTIKGIAHLFSKLGLKRDGILKVVDILNKMLEKYPDESLRRVYQIARQQNADELKVDFREAA
jgi:hypothetical protein